MPRQFYIIVFILLLIMGCKKEDAQTGPVYNPPWYRMAKGYLEKNAGRVWGNIRYTHKSESNQEGQLYDFVLHTGPLEDLPAEKYQIKKFWGHGGDEVPPKAKYHRHVLQMSLSLNGQSVSFPSKSYSDLMDLRVTDRCSLLYKSDSKYYLYLDGSDAGESYAVKFTIEDNKLIKREIWHGEFPELGADVTRYK